METNPGMPRPNETPDKYARRVEGYIFNKYSQGRIPDDGRLDASTYIRAALLMHQLDLGKPDTDPDKAKWDQEQSVRIAEALERARNGDWQGIREWILADADMKKGVSAPGPKVRSIVDIPEEFIQETEKQAMALINLANSI